MKTTNVSSDCEPNTSHDPHAYPRVDERGRNTLELVGLERSRFPTPPVRNATRSQIWVLAVMAGFAALALWLLSKASKR